MPSMPIGLWDDDDGRRYRAAYFERNPGVWTHGDRVEITEHGGVVITGRSDATLNRAGVRIGTAEIYRVVEAIDGVVDSLIVHVEEDDRLLLFLVANFDSTSEVRGTLRQRTSPRHVPDEIHLVPAIPKTLSGKKLEVPVKRILAGAEPADVVSIDSLQDPSALDAFVELAEHRRTKRRR